MTQKREDATHTDILNAVSNLSDKMGRLEEKVDRNGARIEHIERQSAEYNGALKLGKWIVWLMMGIGGATLSVIELTKHLRS